MTTWSTPRQHPSAPWSGRASADLVVSGRLGSAMRALADRHGISAEAAFGVVCAALMHRLTGRTLIMMAVPDELGAPVSIPVRVEPDADFSRLFESVLREGRAAADPATRHDVIVASSARGALGHPASGDGVILCLEAGPGTTWRGQVYTCDPHAHPEFPVLVAERLITLVDAVTASPDAPVDEPDIVGPLERSRLLSFRGDDLPVPDVTVHELIRRQALLHPQRFAVRSAQGRDLTYAQLLDEAAATADRLAACGVRPGHVVGLCSERSVDLVVGLLGILLAGAVYLPLDPASPRARLESMLTSTAARAVLVSDAGRARLEEADALPLIALAGGAARASADWRRRDTSPRDPSSLAYVIFTSGSTGQPKGVEMPHRGVVNSLVSLQEVYRLTSDDLVLHQIPHTFDASLCELLWPLMHGACLVVAPPDAHRDPTAIVDVIRRARVTTLFIVPSMLALLLEEPDLPGCTSLRGIFCGGEALPPEIVNRVTTALPVEVYNLYGPTEAAIQVTAWRCREPEPGPGVPIGSPLANVVVRLLDGRGRLAPLGSRAEIHLGGRCLARGYAASPELTAERFVHHEVDGVIERLYRTGDLAWWSPEGHLNYAGRSDDQVKVRGQRVELGEIEAALHEHPLVRAAAVALRRQPTGGSALVAYVVLDRAAGRQPLCEREVRDFLAERLPGYMVPSRCVELPRLPTTGNGKLDRLALPEPPRRGRRGTGGAE